MAGGNSSYGGYKDLDAAVHEAARIIAKIHSYGMKAGVSIKPRTPVEVVFDLMDKADLILVMTVEPGFGGQKYIPESTDRIRALRTHAGYVNPELRIEVDGGIKTENVQTVLDAGADMIVAGSAVRCTAARRQTGILLCEVHNETQRRDHIPAAWKEEESRAKEFMHHMERTGR